MKLSRFAVALVAMVALVAVEASAQVGAVLGKIVDEEGNPVADVECTVELSGGGGRRTRATTKDDGTFVAAGLRPGTYTITCKKEGYRPLPLQTQVSAIGQGDLGTHVLYELAPGELSEEQHARATELLEEMQAASEEGDPQETLDKLFELQEMMPESKEILFNIGAQYEAMGQMDKAVEYYTQAAESPNLAYDSWLAVGTIHGQAREWTQAAEAMKKATDIQATDPVAMFNFGVYAQNAGDVDTAQAAYEKALELDPTRALAYYQLGLIAVGKGENDKALAHFNKFLELEPDHAQAEAAQGVIDALKQAEAQANK